MKLKLKLLAAAFGLSLMSIAQSQAVMINGTINFSGVATLTGGTALAATATGIDFANPIDVDLGTGDYAGLVADDAATFTDFSFGVIGTTGPNAVSPLWSVGDFYFDLANITVNALSGTQRNIEGTGMAYGPAGFDPTPGDWMLSTSGSRSVLTFSSSSFVPDGGGTLALLGLALVGLPALRKKFTK